MGGRTLLNNAAGTVLGALLVAGCATAPSIPNGADSALSSPSTALRRSLAIASVPLPAPAQYRPHRCSYDATVSGFNSQQSMTRYLVTLKPVRDRFLTTLVGKGQTSTALIGNDGRLYDFNLVSFLNNARMNSQSFASQSQTMAADLQRTQKGRVNVVNEFTMLYPHYVNRNPQPGDVTAVVNAEDGSAWGRYVYRGMTQYLAQNVALLDLIHTSAAMGGRDVTVGYDLVDPSTMAPVLTIVEAGSKLRFARLGCS